MNISEIILSSSLPLDQNPAYVYAASLPAASGRRTQLQALREIASLLGGTIENTPWHLLRHEHTAAIRAQLADRYAPATANKMLSALKQTLKRAWLLGQMDVDDYMKAVSLEPITGQTVPAGRYLTPDEIRAILEVCKSDKNKSAGIRDAAMISIMYIAMLRREEAAMLRRENYDPKTGKLTLTGKRSKQRVDYITNGAKEALTAWLDIRGNEPGALFVAVNKSGKLKREYENMSDKAVYNMVAKRSKQAGVDDNSPHNFRRTGATDYLEAGVDVIAVANLGGWSNIKTVSRYDRRPEEAKRKAAELLHVPY